MVVKWKRDVGVWSCFPERLREPCGSRGRTEKSWVAAAVSRHGQTVRIETRRGDLDLVGLSAVGYLCATIPGSHPGRWHERPCGLTEPADSMSFYREFRQKVNITFNDNDTVSYMENRSLRFQPDRSQGSESDYIVLPNILVLVRR